MKRTMKGMARLAWLALLSGLTACSQEVLLDEGVQEEVCVEQPKCTYYYNLANAFGSADLPFNEGWQNTLTIDINPGAIEFSANVAKWDGAPEGSLTVQ